MKQNTNSPQRNLRWYMRYLHNKIGFFIVGLIIIYGLSGLIQTYRDTDLLKHEVEREQQLQPNLSEAQLGPLLRLRDFKIIKMEGDVLHFQQGTYNQKTGLAKYAMKEWPAWIKALTDLHKTPSKGVIHYFTMLFAIALLFMSVSAFCMFKPGTKLFSSGVYLTVAGVVAALLLLFLS